MQQGNELPSHMRSYPPLAESLEESPCSTEAGYPLTYDAPWLPPGAREPPLRPWDEIARSAWRPMTTLRQTAQTTQKDMRCAILPKWMMERALEREREREREGLRGVHQVGRISDSQRGSKRPAPHCLSSPSMPKGPVIVIFI